MNSKHLHALFLCCAISISCTPQFPPDFITSHGGNFYLDGGKFTLEQAEAQEKYFYERLPSSYSLNPYSIHNYIVNVYASRFDCTYDSGTGINTGHCHGLQDNQYLSIDTEYGPDNSAYLHEVMHLIQQFNGITDYSHTRVQDWKLADGYQNFASRSP